MDKKQDKNVVVLAVRPNYAHAIMSGKKTVEFRRNGTPVNISHVAVYSTSPDKMILGICNVTKCVVASPQQLWRKYGQKGRINRKEFFTYFEGMLKGKCYILKKPKQFSRPILLKDCWSFSRSPQSFVYIYKREWQRLRKKRAKYK